MTLRRLWAWSAAVGCCALQLPASPAQEPAAQAPPAPPADVAVDAVARNQPPPQTDDQGRVRLPETVVPGGRDPRDEGPQSPFPLAPLPDQTVVTPTRTETPLSQVGSSVTVITREQIQERGYSNVAEILRNQLGLDVANAGGPGRQTSVFMRGASSAQTKVMMDGVPLNDPSSPSRAFDFGLLTTDNIERIEVLRGPQSTLYGSDAIGGVINIITARGSGPAKLRAFTGGAAYGTTNQRLSVAGGTDTVYYSLGTSYQDSKGYSSQNFGGERDGYHIGTISARAGWTPTDEFNLDFVVRTFKSNVDLDDFGFDDPLKINRTLTNYARGQATAIFLEGSLVTKFGLSIADTKRDDPTATFSPVRFQGDTYRLDYQANMLLTETNTFTAGVDAQQEDAVTNVNPIRSLYNTGFYIQDQYQIGDRLFGTVGGRWDDYSQAGPAQTYRATTRYWIYETGTSFRGSIGTGFRAPTISDLYTGFVNNPDLKPEESKGWDYGIDQLMFDGALNLGVTYFRNDFTNLIQFAPPFNLYNIGQARSTGLEVSVQTQVDEQTTFGFFYTHQDPRDLTTNTTLLRRPKDKYMLNVVRYLSNDKGFVDLNVQYTGARLDAGFPTNVPLAAYTVVAVSGNYKLGGQWSVFARLDNLFNEKYNEIDTYNVTGTTLFGGLAYGGW